MIVDPLIPASNFQITGKIESITELSEGNIHKTFLLKTEGHITPDYILQHKNKNVFRDVPSMMKNIFLIMRHSLKKFRKTWKDNGSTYWILRIFMNPTGRVYCSFTS